MASSIVPFPRRGANDNNGDGGPPQPGLRSFIVYDELPMGCIAFEDTEGESGPHIKEGEFAVIDTTDRAPSHNEMYMVQWKSSDRRELASLRLRRINVFNDDGTTTPADLWFIGTIAGQQPIALDGSPVGPRIQFVDGPYRDEDAMDRIVGKVVGVYQPDFRSQLRLAA